MTASLQQIIFNNLSIKRAWYTALFTTLYPNDHLLNLSLCAGMWRYGGRHTQYCQICKKVCQSSAGELATVFFVTFSFFLVKAVGQLVKHPPPNGKCLGTSLPMCRDAGEGGRWEQAPLLPYIWGINSALLEVG